MSNKKKAINGAKWTTISTVVNAGLQFAQVAVVARILAPSAFGIISISTLVINFLSIFAHFGFSNSIIYKQESDARMLSTIYYFNIIVGALMFGLMYLSAPLLVDYYKAPGLAPVIRVAAVYFPIVFAGQIYGTLLEKELQFKPLALIEISASVIGTTLTIFLAYKGAEAMSLIYGQLTTEVIRRTAQNILGRKLFSPIRHFRIGEIKDHLRFGLFNTADSLLQFANNNIDTILIGGFLDIKQLGYYTIASQIAVYPIVRIVPIIIQICYPIMARMKDNLAGLRSAYMQLIDFIYYVNLPLLTGLLVMAASVIPMIYGPGWGATVPLIKVFVFVGILSCLLYPTSPLAYSMGKPNLLFYMNLGTFVIKLPLIFFMAKYYGIMGVAFGFLISNAVAAIFNTFLVRYILGNFVKEFLNKLIKPVAFCLVMIVVILVYRRFVGNSGTLNTLVQIGLGGAVYGGLTLKYKISLKEAFGLLRKEKADTVVV